MPDDAVWITEQDATEAIDLTEAIDEIGAAFAREHAGVVTPLDKTLALWGGSHTLHALGAIDTEIGLAGTKTWCHTAGGATPLLILWDAETGRLRAVIEAFVLGQLRTAAVSGVATRALAAPDARTLAIIGSGKQALAQVATVLNVRDIDRVAVYSRTPENRDAFAAKVAGLAPEVTVTVAESADEAADGAHVITTITRSTTPFLHADALSAGTHLNAVGAITPERAELDAGIIRGASVVCADSVPAAQALAAELRDASEVLPLSAVVADPTRHASSSGWSVFKAMGVGLADLALGHQILRRVVASGGGRPVPQPTKAAPRLMKGRG